MATQTTRKSATATPPGGFRRLCRGIDRRLGPADERWAKPPAVASLLCVPALLFYALSIDEFGLDDRRSGVATMAFAGLVALALAWLLPHRESARFGRVTFAVTGAALLLLPALLFASVMIAWICVV
ncbi:hypothetical protein ACH4PU_15620 [Streptomyces sp. NPDC021100]|uniref:hypothetical protein n=1 Tax=Streptomyces sp. NPDC021100 TaxID=3365114 RepID=UPI0037B5E04C